MLKPAHRYWVHYESETFKIIGKSYENHKDSRVKFACKWQRLLDYHVDFDECLGVQLI